MYQNHSFINEYIFQILIRTVFPFGLEKMNEASEKRRPGPHNIFGLNRNYGRGREGLTLNI